MFVARDNPSPRPPPTSNQPPPLVHTVKIRCAVNGTEFLFLGKGSPELQPLAYTNEHRGDGELGPLEKEAPLDDNCQWGAVSAEGACFHDL